MTLPLGASDMKNETGWAAIKANIYSKLSVDKYNMIMKYWTFPLATSVLANDIVTDLYKVFDGRNPVFHIDYQNDRMQEMADPVLAQLGITAWIEKEGKKVLNHAPNTIAVVDKDESGYPLLLAINNNRLVDYDFVQGSDSQFEYIAFVHSKGETNGDKWTKFSVYDDEFYRVITLKNNIYTEDFANTHPLGYCPAMFMYNKALISEDRFNRSIPFSSVRGAMFQWTIFDLFENQQDSYAGFQILEYAATVCLEDNCENGTVYYDAQVDENGNVVKPKREETCQTCANNGFVGPGSGIGVVVGNDKDDQDTRGVLRFVSPDITATKYIGEKQLQKQSFIKENTVGASNAMNKEAINELQVYALMDSKNKPLFEIKSYWERLNVWLHETSIKVTFEGSNPKAYSNYGTEFFVLTVDKIIAIIKAAKESGVQSSYIEQLNKMLIITQYKSDPILVKRMLISADLEPNAYDNQVEARAKFKEGMMAREDYYLKSNFTDLLNDFERDNGSIVAFGKDIDMPYNEKIKKIRETLHKYVEQKIPQNEEIEDTESDNAKPTSQSDS